METLKRLSPLGNLDSKQIWPEIGAEADQRNGRTSSGTPGTLVMNLDHPAAHSSVFSGSILLVRGWATARDGIEKVEIRIDDGESLPATYGLLREDVESIYPDFADASRTGFIAAFGSGNLGAGEHTVHAIATSKSGAWEDKSVSFSVDRRTEYEIWAGIQQPTRDHLLMLLDEQLRLGYRPLVSIITPVYRTPREFLKRCVGSVLKQAYPNWELILVDDCSDDPALSELLRSFEAQDRRIRVIGLAENQGIAGASNAGLKACRGSYVGLLDHDDELAPNALFEICKALNEDRALDVLYSDEDKIDETGKLCDPFFKPNWSPDLLLSMNYICHFLVARTSLLNSVDGFRTKFDGSQDYDLVLRLAEQTDKIHRIPKVLYHWRIHRNSTASGVGVKPGATSAGRRAIQGHLDRRGVNAQAIEIGAGRYRVRYRHSDKPEVGIVVPTGGSSTLRSALESVLEKTSYPNFRITVVDNSKTNSVREVVSKVQATSERVELVDCRNLPFNFSYLCNYGAAYGRSPYLMFLNDDTSIITPDWLEAMMEHAQRDEVGAVGAQLLFPNDTTQHAGVVMGLMGLASHPFRGLPPELHYFALSQYIRNCAAVTGACLLTRRDVFDAVEGFDEDNLPTCFQDVDICLKMVERGYRIVYTPYARLYHYESYSKKAIANLSELEYMRERWADMIADDPFYNPCLTRTADDYGLNYDRLFSQAENEGSGDEKKVEQAGVIEGSEISHLHSNVRHHGRVEFYALPNPLTTRSGPGQTALFWDVEGVKKVQIRVNGPGGPLFAEEGPSGKASTGPWVEPNTTFYLLDATKTSTPSPEQVLATVTIRTLAREQSYAQLAARQHA